ncbi:MAG TPA: hypothetical protein VGF55_18510, partial [Gemmataceae bacterium]
LSNSDTPFVRDLFRGYTIRTIDNRREINLDSGNRAVTELLIMNYDPPKMVRRPVQLSLFDEPPRL